MPYGLRHLPLFYDVARFGTACARRRQGEPDFPFSAIYGSVDQTGLDGMVITHEHGISYPTASVDLNRKELVIVGFTNYKRNEDRSIEIVGDAAEGGTLYKVRSEPYLINDGAETSASLSEVRGE